MHLPGPSVWMYAIHYWFEKVIYGTVLAGAELFQPHQLLEYQTDLRTCRSVLLSAYSWRICTGCSDLGYRMPVVTAMVSAGFPHWLLSPGRHILFIFIFHSSNEWWRWPRQSGRAHKDKSLFHTAASIYWCCPQHDGSLANASFWWHWGCFWFFYLGNASGENCQIVSVHFSLFECLFLCQLFLVFAFFERWRRSC